MSRKAYILIDGKETSYKEYKKIDPTKFAEIHVLPGKDEIIRLFGRKSQERNRALKDEQIH